MTDFELEKRKSKALDNIRELIYNADSDLLDRIEEFIKHE